MVRLLGCLVVVRHYTQRGFDGCLERLFRQVVHVVHDAQGGFLRLLGDERKQSRLRQLVLHAFNFVVNGECMRGWRIVDHAHTAVLHHVVYVVHVVLQLVGGFLQPDNVFLQARVRLGQFRDVAPTAEDA